MLLLFIPSLLLVMFSVPYFYKNPRQPGVPLTREGRVRFGLILLAGIGMLTCILLLFLGVPPI